MCRVDCGWEDLTPEGASYRQERSFWIASRKISVGVIRLRTRWLLLGKS